MLIDSFANLNEQDFNLYLSQQIEENGVPRVIVFYAKDRISAFKLKHLCDAFGIESCICGAAKGVDTIQGMMFWIKKEDYFVYQEEQTNLSQQIRELGILAKRAFNCPHIFLFNIDLELSTDEIMQELEIAGLEDFELFYDPLIIDCKKVETCSSLKLLNAVVFNGVASGLCFDEEQIVQDDHSNN